MKPWKKFAIPAAVVVVLLMVTWRPAWAILVNAYFDYVQIATPAAPPTGSRTFVNLSTHKFDCINSDSSSCAPSGGGSFSVSGYYLNDGTNNYIGPTNQIATLPMAGTYAWINQGSATETTAGNALILHSPPNAGATSVNIRAAAISTNHTLTVALICNIVQGTAGTTACFAGFYEGSSGKLETLELVNGFVQVNRFLSPTVFNANIFNASSPGAPTVLWARLIITGGTISYSFSVDGVHFPVMYSEAQNAYFTTAPDNWFYATDSENTTSDAYATLLSWNATP
jgi:hypothetical protein